MAKAITKHELEQQLIASQRDNAALRAEISVLRASNEVLRSKLAEAAEALQSGSESEQANVAQQAQQASRPWPTVKQHLAERQLPAHFAAAREAAMRLGRSVKVGA